MISAAPGHSQALPTAIASANVSPVVSPALGRRLPNLGRPLLEVGLARSPANLQKIPTRLNGGMTTTVTPNEPGYRGTRGGPTEQKFRETSDGAEPSIRRIYADSESAPRPCRQRARRTDRAQSRSAAEAIGQNTQLTFES